MVGTQSFHIDSFGKDTFHKQEKIFNIRQHSKMEITSKAKASQQYTNVANYSIVCFVCKKLLPGQTEYKTHAKANGHMNCGEI